jgi:hypothetical protein
LIARFPENFDFALLAVPCRWRSNHLKMAVHCEGTSEFLACSSSLELLGLVVGRAPGHRLLTVLAQQWRREKQQANQQPGSLAVVLQRLLWGGCGFVHDSTPIVADDVDSGAEKVGQLPLFQSNKGKYAAMARRDRESGKMLYGSAEGGGTLGRFGVASSAGSSECSTTGEG